MANIRGKYASPAQTERRKRILRETLKLLEQESPSGISMAQIAELSDVSTKIIYEFRLILNVILFYTQLFNNNAFHSLIYVTHVFCSS